MDMVARHLKNHTPVIGYAELTLKCNLKCVQCYLEEDIPTHKEELTREEWNVIFATLAELGTTVMVATGGDIFMRKDTMDILRDMRKYGFAVVIFTNGTLLNEEQSKEIYDLAPLGVEISVHAATAEVHDAITQVKGSFEKSVATIRSLKNHKVRVKLKCNLMKINRGDYESVISLADELGVEYSFDPYIFPGRDGNLAQTENRVEDEIMEKILSDPRILPRSSCEGAKSYLEIKGNRLCGAGQNLMVVSSNGDVFPCIPLKLKAGNVRENNLEHIWAHSPVFNKLRGFTNADLEDCPTCEHVHICGRCTAMAYNETGRLLGCAPASRALNVVKQRILDKEEAAAKSAAFSTSQQETLAQSA